MTRAYLLEADSAVPQPIGPTNSSPGCWSHVPDLEPLGSARAWRLFYSCCPSTDRALAIGFAETTALGQKRTCLLMSPYADRVGGYAPL